MESVGRTIAIDFVNEDEEAEEEEEEVDDVSAIVGEEESEDELAAGLKSGSTIVSLAGAVGAMAGLVKVANVAVSGLPDSAAIGAGEVKLNETNTGGSKGLGGLPSGADPVTAVPAVEGLLLVRV